MKTQKTRRHFLTDIPTIGFGILCLTNRSLADVGGAESATRRSRVIAACSKHWPDNKGDCSAFVRAVASDLGFSLNGNADHIYTEISKAPWNQIGIGKAAAAIAGVAAGEGKVVLAAGHGHVAVVVDYRNAFDTYSAVDRNKAVAFWGKLHSVGKEYQRVTQSWTEVDLPQVLFAYRDIS